MDQVAKAKSLAAEAHFEQRDKAGKPYIDHPARVAMRVDGDPQAECVAWLHDVVEDTDVTLERLRSEFSAAVVEAVDCLTRRKGEPDLDYYVRIRPNALAKRVKLADIADNSDPERLARLPEPTRERLQRKYIRARNAINGGEYLIADRPLGQWRIDLLTGSLCRDGWSADGCTDWGYSVDSEHFEQLSHALGFSRFSEVIAALEAGHEIEEEWLVEQRIPHGRFRWP